MLQRTRDSRCYQIQNELSSNLKDTNVCNKVLLWEWNICLVIEQYNSNTNWQFNGVLRQAMSTLCRFYTAAMIYVWEVGTVSKISDCQPEGPGFNPPA